MWTVPRIAALWRRRRGIHRLFRVSRGRLSTPPTRAKSLTLEAASPARTPPQLPTRWMPRRTPRHLWRPDPPRARNDCQGFRVKAAARAEASTPLRGCPHPRIPANSLTLVAGAPSQAPPQLPTSWRATANSSPPVAASTGMTPQRLPTSRRPRRRPRRHPKPHPQPPSPRRLLASVIRRSIDRVCVCMRLCCASASDEQRQTARQGSICEQVAPTAYPPRENAGTQEPRKRTHAKAQRTPAEPVDLW